MKAPLFIVALLLSICTYFYFTGNPIPEYLLITKGQMTDGVVTKVQQYDDDYDDYDNHKGGIVTSTFYTYKFEDAQGNTMSGIASGHIDGCPDEIDEPFPVKIEYLSENPRVSRIKNIDTADQTVFSWFRTKIVLGLIISSIVSWLIYGSVKEKFFNNGQRRNPTSAS